MTEPIKLGIALPAYGLTLDVGHAAMWLGLGAALASAQELFRLQWMAEYHINGVDLCRNMIVYDAMQAGCDWVLMVDADTFHRSGGVDGKVDAVADAGVDLLQMIRDGDREKWVVEVDQFQPIIHTSRYNGIALIGAPVRGRGGKPDPCVVSLQEDAHIIPIEYIRGNVFPVRCIGAACVAINLKWLREHWPKGPWFLMEYNFDERPKYARSEDYYFCDEARKRRGAIICDGRFVPEHVAGRRLVGEL